MTSYQCGPQHPIYGISWKNIVKTLNYNNWRAKAIVRAGVYIYVNKGCYKEDGEPVTAYTVFWEKNGIPCKNFSRLKDAMEHANNWSDHEGDWPLPWKPGWTISTIGPFRKRSEQ